MIRFLLNLISNLLSFSKTESRGVLVLFLICIIAIFFNIFLVDRLKSNTPKWHHPDGDLLTEWTKTVDSSIVVKKKNINKQTFTKTKVYSYRSKNNKKKPSKLKYEKKTPPPKIKKIVIKDLNTATPKDLQEVRGIGKTFSNRIIKYRELLGGFYNEGQLREVYGLNDDEVLLGLARQFKILSDVVPLSINTDSVRILASHPYISYDLAWIIYNYRKQHGDIQSAETLKKIDAISDSLFHQLKPYLAH